MTADPSRLEELVRDEAWRCCGCGRTADDTGETGCDCATASIFRRSDHDCQVKPWLLNEEANSLRRRADELDAKAERVREMCAAALRARQQGADQ